MVSPVWSMTLRTLGSAGLLSVVAVMMTTLVEPIRAVNLRLERDLDKPELDGLNQVVQLLAVTATAPAEAAIVVRVVALSETVDLLSLTK